MPRRVVHARMGLVVIVNDYAYLVPFVVSEEESFLKTVIPSRKATREYVDESDENT